MKIAKKLIILTIALIIAIATFPNIAINVSATAKTQDEAINWVKSQVGKSIDYDGYAGYQCVDLILAYYNYLGVSTVSGNGKDYATNTLPAGWTRTKGGTPKKGDILVYTNGTYGHVGIYESNSVSYHQNIDGKKYVVKTSYKYNSLSDYWGCITPNWGGEEYFSSVYSYDISDTNASIKGEFNNLTTIKGAGFYIGTSQNSLTKITKNLSGGSDGAGNFKNIYYTMSKWYGTLTPGTTYYYKLWFTDSNGKEQNSKVYSFKTTGTSAPTKSTISMSNNRIVAGNSITFTYSSDYATRYNLGIDAQDGTRYFTSGSQAGTTYTYTCNEVGLYSAYVTAGNDKGYKDSARVYFQVISDTPTKVNSIESNGHTYDLYLAAITWENAKTWCENNGGHLVTITSADEQADVERLLGNHKSGCYWFGGEETTGTYRWVTGEPWEYENWPADGSEPNHSVSSTGEIEHYLGTNYGTEWNDFPNGPGRLCGFVMEIEPVPEVPSAPTGLTAKATGDKKITVSWDAVESATQYNVYRYNGTKNTYVYKGTTYATAANPTQYVDADLYAGTTYYYKVVAVNKTAGYTLVSEKSAAANATAVAAPSIPQNVAAKATGEKVITVSWSAVQGATQYNIYRYNGTKKEYVYKGTTFATAAKPTQYVDNNLNADTNYYYKVVAVNKTADYTLVSEKSAAASAKAVGIPASPKNVTAKATGEKVITVSWSAVQGATQYNIYRYNSTKKEYVYKGTTFATAAKPTQYADKDLNLGTTYYYKVVAVKKTADYTLVSEKSSAANAKALGTPAIPQNVKAVSNEAKKVTVSWSKVKGATQYNVYRYNSTKGDYVYVGTTFATAEKPTQYEVTGLSSGTTYYFKVLAAAKGDGLTFVGEKSASVSAKVK